MKRFIAILLCLSMLMSFMPIIASAEGKLVAGGKEATEFKADKSYFCITPEQITEKGGWMLADGNPTGSYRSQVMYDQGNGGSAAKMEVVVPRDEVYTLFVHTRDFADRQGTRTFDIEVDGKRKGIGGVHGGDGWAWEKYEMVVLTGGKHTISFIDGNTWARFDLVLLTDDKDFVPSNTEEGLKKLETDYLYDESKIVVEESKQLEGRPDTEIAVKFNGEWMNFDVDPVLINDRTMVPLRAIFEALGASVSWDNDTETAKGVRNGRAVTVTIGSNIASVAGSPVTIDQSAVLMNDRTLVPLRFISEAYDADVQWDDPSQTVIINALIPPVSFYITSESYYTYGTWGMDPSTSDGAGVLKGTTPSARADGKSVTIDDADPSKNTPAIAKIDVPKEGDYQVWVRARDFKTNQQGTRFFDVTINGEKTARTYGKHAQEGFVWEDAGVVHLKEGENTIEAHDTSGFFARLAGIFITEEIGVMPSNDHKTIMKTASPIDALESISTPSFPLWARADLPAEATASIENDDVKVNFYKVTTPANGTIVQNEIFVKDNGEWVSVKGKTEEHGYLMQKAIFANQTSVTEGIQTTEVKFVKDGKEYAATTKNLFKTGAGEWLIPIDYKVIDEKTVELIFADRDDMNVSVTWAIDQRIDPKVTVNADIKQDGYYTFIVSNGAEYSDDNFIAGTIPFRVVEQRIPLEPAVIIEQYLSTPMGTVTVNKNGKEFTQGVVVDGENLEAEWVYKENSEFGIGLRGPGKGLKGVITAPLMGTEYSNMKAGTNYNFSYRVVNKFANWFDTYTHITQNIFDVHDYRSNYYNNLNDAIFNTTDLMADDFYGGWDPVGMAQYNMEGRDLVTSGNPMIAVQRYLLTEDEELMESRAIPTLAFLTSRQKRNFKAVATDTGHTLIVEPTSGLEAKAYPENYFNITVSAPGKQEFTVKYAEMEPVDGKVRFYLDTKEIPFTCKDGELTGASITIEKIDVVTGKAETIKTTVANNKVFGSGGPWSSYVSNPVSKIGTPVFDYNFGAFGGLYEMSQGAIPALLGITEERAVSGTGSGYVGVMNNLTMYRYTKDNKYLEAAKKVCDAYLETTLYNESYMSRFPEWGSFINISYSPNLAALIDIYEATGEQKYLDAAERAGQMLIVSQWSTGIDNGKGDTPYEVKADYVYNVRGFMEGHNFFWHGTDQWRVGSDDGEVRRSLNGKVKLPESETVPGWLPTRVGLGLEQASTFGEALNIIMSNWAPDMVRLAKYTGNEYFEIAARNAIIGRFGNYPGYYQNRYITHQMKPDYPYNGPDYTSVYWHHITPFLAMIEEFLITDIWYKSDAKIEFPRIRQQGYAYFDSSQYGFDAGKMYDVDGLWLWNDREIVKPDSVQLDYLPAKKNGVLAVAFMNEDKVDTTSVITLGEKVPSYTGTATVYDAEGNKSTVEVTDGKFQITVPAKDILTVVMNIDGIKEPSYASGSHTSFGDEIGGTVVEHERGRGYALQLSGDKYYAYVYITDMDEKGAGTEKEEHRASYAKLTYTINGKTETKIRAQYPFEFIIPVDDVNAEFTYEVEAVKADGTKENLGGGTLMTAAKSKEKGVKFTGKATPVVATSTPSSSNTSATTIDPSTIKASADLPNFKPFVAQFTQQGVGAGTVRFVIPKGVVPFEHKQDLLRGVQVTVQMREVATGKTYKFDTVATGSEVRADGGVTLVVLPKDQLQTKDYWNDKAKTHQIILTLSMPGTDTSKLGNEKFPDVKPGEVTSSGSTTTKPTTPTTPTVTKLPDFKPFLIKSYKGQGTGNGLIRLVVEKSAIPFEVSQDLLKDVKAEVTLIENGTGKKTVVNTTLAGNEMRSDGNITLLINPSGDLKCMDYDNDKAQTHKFEVKLSKPE